MKPNPSEIVLAAVIFAAIILASRFAPEASRAVETTAASIVGAFFLGRFVAKKEGDA